MSPLPLCRLQCATPTRVMTAVVAAPTRHPAATSPRKCRPSSARLAAVAAPQPSTAAASGFDVACQHTAANSAMKDALHCHSIFIWVSCKLTSESAMHRTCVWVSRLSARAQKF
jgi:hypothetical protein